MMIKRRAILLVAIATLGLTFASAALAQQETTESASNSKSDGVGSATVLTFHGKIVEIDKTKKQVILEGAEGRKLTLQVENPYNLEAVKVGDSVVARFYEVVTIRKKKPGENLPSASLKEGIVTAVPGAVPGGVAEQKASFVVSVVAIDSSNGTVTVKGPDGSTETVKARNPKNLSKLSIGDDLVVSVSRALGITLGKESGK